MAISSAIQQTDVGSHSKVGAKRRKSTSAQMFTKDITSDVVKDTQDAVANGTSVHLVEFMMEEILHYGFVGSGSGENNMCDDFQDTYA
ncbi:hypothetical protein FXO37_08038 [Capsicum annuum]|nr:hypothetical protein FXO37_08038 [Capsicum annuum]